MSLHVLLCVHVKLHIIIAESEKQLVVTLFIHSTPVKWI